ncbi:hypothetical protein ACFYXS_18440 [Streptomyces sp. NPDC002574]|uniref:hypothetical protein n=1 Tax=Streptomyces sp. NPDC002574 TaxID=3364652 RepID=UPI00369BEF41
MRIPSVTAVVLAGLAALVALGPVAYATKESGDGKGTVAVYDEALGAVRGDKATVCTFHIRGEGFGPGQAVNWSVGRAKGGPAMNGTFVTGDEGTGSSARIVLANGGYRLTWLGDGAKPRSFTVACAAMTQTPAPAAPASPVPSYTPVPAASTAVVLPGQGPLSAASGTLGEASGTAGAVGAALAAAALCGTGAAAVLLRRRRPARRVSRHRRAAG